MPFFQEKLSKFLSARRPPSALALCVAGLACLLSFGSSMRAQGSPEIPFRKHTLDLGPSETVAVADVNRDGRLDIISGEYWYEQLPPAAAKEGPRWKPHKFRDLSYTEFYLEDLSDLAIDING